MHNDIKDKMESVEMNQTKEIIKSIWVKPELEILDGRKTFEPGDPSITEDFGGEAFES